VPLQKQEENVEAVTNMLRMLVPDADLDLIENLRVITVNDLYREFI